MTQSRIACPAAVLLLGSLAALSCRSPDYFPLRNGQQWRYVSAAYRVAQTDTVVTESLTYTVAVTDASTEPGFEGMYEVNVARDSEPYLSFIFRRTRGAVFVLPASQFDELGPTSGWVKLLELPLRDGAFWHGDSEGSVSFEARARETVETAAGHFRDCFRIRIHAAEPYRMDVWLAPDAGVIRWTRRYSASRFEVAERIRR